MKNALARWYLCWLRNVLNTEIVVYCISVLTKLNRKSVLTYWLEWSVSLLAVFLFAITDCAPSLTLFENNLWWIWNPLDRRRTDCNLIYNSYAWNVKYSFLLVKWTSTYWQHGAVVPLTALEIRYIGYICRGFMQRCCFIFHYSQLSNWNFFYSVWSSCLRSVRIFVGVVCCKFCKRHEHFWKIIHLWSLLNRSPSCIEIYFQQLFRGSEMYALISRECISTTLLFRWGSEFVSWN